MSILPDYDAVEDRRMELEIMAQELEAAKREARISALVSEYEQDIDMYREALSEVSDVQIELMQEACSLRMGFGFM